MRLQGWFYLLKHILPEIQILLQALAPILQVHTHKCLLLQLLLSHSMTIFSLVENCKDKYLILTGSLLSPSTSPSQPSVDIFGSTIHNNKSHLKLLQK